MFHFLFLHILFCRLHLLFPAVDGNKNMSPDAFHRKAHTFSGKQFLIFFLF